MVVQPVWYINILWSVVTVSQCCGTLYQRTPTCCKLRNHGANTKAALNADQKQLNKAKQSYRDPSKTALRSWLLQAKAWSRWKQHHVRAQKRKRAITRGHVAHMGPAFAAWLAQTCMMRKVKALAKANACKHLHRWAAKGLSLSPHGLSKTQALLFGCRTPACLLCMTSLRYWQNQTNLNFSPCEFAKPRNRLF